MRSFWMAGLAWMIGRPGIRASTSEFVLTIQCLDSLQVVETRSGRRWHGEGKRWSRD